MPARNNKGGSFVKWSNMKEIQQFLDEWEEDGLETKPVFEFLYGFLQEKKEVKCEFHPRPGISYSLRGTHPNQKDRPLFVMIDVIDDEPGKRWLSVCFFQDMISDPKGLGDLIPGGLLGSDGYCFDAMDADEQVKNYLKGRIREAWEIARGNG